MVEGDDGGPGRQLRHLLAQDENYRVLRSVRKQLDALRDQDGRPFEIVEIPMPDPVEHDGQRLPATYVNFYFVNGALLVLAGVTMLIAALRSASEER